MHVIDRVVAEVDRAADEIVDYTADLVRIPTVNPPGEAYEECARFIGQHLATHGFDVEYIVAEGRAEHSATYPRVNVVGTRRSGPGAVVHLNGHFDVVPAGDGWTLDPFAGIVRDGKLEIPHRDALADAAGVELPGTIEISGTVDEESGGFAGVAWLAECGRVATGKTDYVIIPEPLNVDRICIGHRGVYWFELTTKGRIGHGSMPFLGISAIEGMGRVLDAIRSELKPRLAGRTTSMPVVPEGARHATININALPTYFNITSSSILTVQGFFNGSLGSDGVTNLEGIANNAGNATINQPVGLRALYLQNTSNTATTPFFAAKIRQP